MNFFTFFTSKTSFPAMSDGQPGNNIPRSKSLQNTGKTALRGSFLLVLLLAACIHVNAAVSVVRGKVVDADTKEPLVSATITIKGTNKSASAGLDGSFRIDVTGFDNPVLVFTYLGYVPQEIPVAGKTDLGEISLKSASTGMSEVVVNGDVAIDRKTPVAVTTIGSQYIEEHIGTQDIPELLNIVPGVYATQQGGGYGDSRISIRGFSSQSGNGNVAYTINGIPVNDPETGAIYWSDFSGVTDVTSSIQVQRGLGASKVIVPSFGGTINITSRSTDAQQGGYVWQTVGSDGYEKTAVLVSTGVNNGWAATIEGSRTSGNGDADGLNFLAYNYFVNISKILTPNQTLSFNLIGGDQHHGERFEESILDYQQAPQGIRWNAGVGVKDGEQINPYTNFFSEPFLSLNHEWTINDNSSLSTEFYGIFGSGGGGEIGGATPSRISNLYSPYDFTAAEQANAASPDGSALTWLYNSHDITDWYGLRSTFKTMLGKYTTLQAGVDLRYYHGLHYEELTDPLGANYVLDAYSGAKSTAEGESAGNINNPNNMAVAGDKINYDNEDYELSESAFAQAEYSKDKFTAFLTATGENSGLKRVDYFNYLNSDPEQKTPYVNFQSFQLKGGANYNLNDQMNVYANIGYLTKPPYYASVFENYTNQINKAAVDEKLFSYELGYGYKSSGFSAKVDLYRTAYKDRSDQSAEYDPATNQQYSANVTGVDELHQGLEAVLIWKPIKEITLRGSGSFGDYYYTNNPGPTSVFNNQEKLVETIPVIDLKNEKIGDAPQTTASMSLDVNVLPQVKLGVIWNYFSNYTANVPFEDYTSPDLHPYKVPDYSLWTFAGTWHFKMAGFDSELIGTVTNLLNTKYISDATDAGATGLASNAEVYYGLGRLFTTGLKVKF